MMMMKLLSVYSDILPQGSDVDAGWQPAVKKQTNWIKEDKMRLTDPSPVDFTLCDLFHSRWSLPGFPASPVRYRCGSVPVSIPVGFCQVKGCLFW